MVPHFAYGGFAKKRREEELRRSMQAEQNARAMSAFGAAIRDKVTRNWLRPPGSSMGLSCTLKVRVAASGTVLGVQILRSSGNGAFDRSAEAAVFKSDPFPKPPVGIRDITFEFDPDKQ